VAMHEEHKGDHCRKSGRGQRDQGRTSPSVRHGEGKIAFHVF
jgi:hypothetical protein